MISLGGGTTAAGLDLSVDSVTVREQSADTCVGNCNGDDSVTVDEILDMVNIALSNTDISTCTAGNANGDYQVIVDEILTAVNNALNGCGG
jgi:hypothetical protein